MRKTRVKAAFIYFSSAAVVPRDPDTAGALAWRQVGVTQHTTPAGPVRTTACLSEQNYRNEQVVPEDASLVGL